MPGVGFEPTIPMFERAKTVHALGRAANVIGTSCCNILKLHILLTECICVLCMVLKVSSDLCPPISVNRLVFVTERYYVSCEVRTEFLYIN
jgi:hypothetical protein